MTRFNWIFGLSLVVVFMLMKMTVLAASEPGELTPVDMAKGKKILETRCSVCHAAPRPKDYTIREWPGIINKMGAKANLRASDQELLLEYVKATLKASR